jgi:hypothetical protein
VEGGGWVDVILLFGLYLSPAERADNWFFRLHPAEHRSRSVRREEGGRRERKEGGGRRKEEGGRRRKKEEEERKGGGTFNKVAMDVRPRLTAAERADNRFVAFTRWNIGVGV